MNHTGVVSAIVRPEAVMGNLTGYLVLEEPYHDNSQPLALFENPQDAIDFVRTSDLTDDGFSIYRITGTEVKQVVSCFWPGNEFESLDDFEASLGAGDA